MNTSRMGAAILMTAMGCTGSIGDPGGSSSRRGGSNGEFPTTGECQEDVPLVTAARRLTRSQYANILRDLRVDLKGTAADQLPVDDAGDDVAPDPRSMIVSSDWAASAMSAAEMAAKMAIAALPTLLPCDPVSGEQACARKFIAAFGQRAYRRPLETAEVDGLMKVYGVGTRGGGFAHGVEVAIRAMLQAPSFLYLLELGQPAGSSGKAVRLSPYEVASRLSFLFWNTMPDDTLFAAAANDKLSTQGEIATQARRLLADPKAEDPLVAFHAKWVGIDGLASVNRDPQKYPAFGDELVASMRTELDLYLKDVLFKGDGRLESLFESHFTYVDSLVAPLYGVAQPASGGFIRVDLDPKQRAGILTNVGIITSHTMADESQAIHRGKFIRQRLLCSPLSDPPPSLMVTPPTPKPGVSTRERLKEHSSTLACQGCHKMMDPIGFGFEAYDGLGQFRTTDPNGQPVDDSGTLDMTDVDGPFKGVVALGQKLATSAQVRECVASSLIRYARGPEADGDACVRRKLVTAFDHANHDIKELLIALTQTDGFPFRRAIEGELLQ